MEENKETASISEALPDKSVNEEKPLIEMSHEPKLGLKDGISLIFGLMIGSGIFSSAGLVLADVGSAGMTLIIWLVTGVLGLTGALW